MKQPTDISHNVAFLSRKQSVQPRVSIEDEDVVIDPRAKVMLAIGNNMFDLGNLNSGHEPPASDRKMRRSKLRGHSEDVTHAFSYKSLLKELGIVKENDPPKKTREEKKHRTEHPTYWEA